MDSTHKFSNKISYDLAVTYAGDQIHIALHASDRTSAKTYSRVIGQQSNYQLQQYFPANKQLFEFLAKEDNFVVDPINGKIVLRI